MRDKTIRRYANLLFMFVVVTLICSVSAFANHPFEPWEDEVFVAVGKEHGPEAEKRIRKVMDIILANHDKPVMEKLELTNTFLNNLRISALGRFGRA